ncbi:MAG TPA: response regulator transcription factor [Rhizomicrobium sp.]|nr:response regulator transcription factor [Rhizomicrobium sp.]
MSKHVAIVEDDPDVRAILERCLSQDGYRVTALSSGAEIDGVMSEKQVDLVILDVGLPDVDGLTITQQIRRRSDVGIIIVSGRGDLADRVVGLEIGADDYVTKPFEPREVLARVRSVLRRGHRKETAPAEDGHTLYLFGDWALDVTAQRLSGAHDQSVTLTSGEFKLLETLVSRAGRVLSRDQIMDACHSNDTPAFDRSIDVCIGRLRKKLGDDAKNPSFIKTVRNGGYIFAVRVTKRAS